MLEKTIKHHKKIMWALVAASIAMLFFSPLNELKETVSEALPWVLTGVLITESLFVIGIIIMAIAVEYELGLNPLKWRSHIKSVLHHVPENRLFWIGFWINAIGALGSGIVVAAGILISLPATSWGLIWLPFLDLSLTVALRITILELKKETTVEET
jgi:hypothetical protein